MLALPAFRPSVWHFEALDTPAGDEPQRVSVAVQGPLRASNSEVLREATLAGLGIGLLPDFSAALALRAGRLKPVLPGWQPVGVFGDGIFALRPWSAHVPKAVHTLVAHLRTTMARAWLVSECLRRCKKKPTRVAGGLKSLERTSLGAGGPASQWLRCRKCVPTAPIRLGSGWKSAALLSCENQYPTKPPEQSRLNLGVGIKVSTHWQV